MMFKLKRLILIATVVSFHFANSQSIIEGRIMDKETSEPIPFAHMYDPENGLGTTTNLLGEFILNYPESLVSVSLRISHIGYTSTDIVLYSNSEFLELTLIPQSELLNEIVVSPKDPYQLVEQCIHSIKENYPTDGYTLSGFQREVITRGDEHVQLLEAEYSTILDDGESKSYLIDGRFAENKPYRIKDNLWNDKRGGFYALGITSLGAPNQPSAETFLGVPTNKIENYYQLTYDGTADLATGNAYRISFQPFEKVKKPLVTGTLYIDIATNALVEMNYHIADQNKAFLKTNKNWKGNDLSTAPAVKKVFIKDEKRTLKYRPFGEKWFLSSIIHDIEFIAEVKLPVKSIAESRPLHLHLEQVVTNISPSVSSPDVPEVPTEMYYFQVHLKNNAESYDSSHWNQPTGIKSNIDNTSIFRDLTLKNKTVNE